MTTRSIIAWSIWLLRSLFSGFGPDNFGFQYFRFHKRPENERFISISTTNVSDSNSSKNQRFGLILSIRGLASIYVSFVHLCLLIPQPENWLLKSMWFFFVSSNKAGVTVFFVMSGFVLPHSVRWVGSTHPSWAEFMIHRLVRLTPPYWVALGLTAAGYKLASFFHDGQTFFLNGYILTTQSFLHNLLFLQLQTGQGQVTAVSWALVVQLQLYLVFLTFFAVMMRLEAVQSRRLYPAATLAIGSISLLAGFRIVDTPTTVLPVLYPFVFGLLTYWVMVRKIAVQWVLATLTIFAAAGSLNLANGSILGWDRGFIYSSIGTTLLLLTAVKLNGLDRWLRFRPLHFLGKISYSTYLTHPPVQAFCIMFSTWLLGRNPLGYTLAVISSVIASFLTATITNRFVEQPARNWSTQLKQSSRP